MRRKERRISSKEVVNRLKYASWVIIGMECELWNYYSEVRLCSLEENWWEDREKYYIRLVKNVYENQYEKHSSFEDKEEFAFSKNWTWTMEQTEEGQTLFITRQNELEISFLLLEEQKEEMEPMMRFGYPEIKRKFLNSNKVNIVIKSAIFQQICNWKVEGVEEDETGICVTGKGENLFRVSKEWTWIKAEKWINFEKGNTETLCTNINSNMGGTEIVCTFYY